MVEVVGKIKAAEAQAEELRKAARIQAAAVRDAAVSEGRQLLETERQSAARAAADITGKADAAAQEQLKNAAQAAAGECDALLARARANLDKAADLVVERIVDSL